MRRLSTKERLLLDVAYMDQLDQIQRLLEQKGVNLDVKDKAGLTPLVHACLERTP